MVGLVGLAGLACVPLAKGDFFLSHDLLFWPYRLWELDRCIRDGQFFARWFPDFGWGKGMPFLNFYAPLFLYLAEGLHLAGLTLLGALKAMIFVILAGSAVGMYLLVRQGHGREASLIAGASYLFGPYFLTVVYLRGGLAEGLGFLWMPFCLLALRKAVVGGGRAAILLGGLSLAALILTHNITAMLFLPVALAYGVVMGWGVRGSGGRLAACFALGLGLSAFFWFPALSERRYVRMEEVVADRYQYQRNFASLSHLWDVTGETTHPLTEDGVHLTLGGPQILLALLSLLALPKARRQGREILFFWVLLVGGLLMILPLSKPIWAALPPLRYVQFPWRWMGLCTLSLACLGARGLEVALKKNGELGGAGSLALVGGFAVLVPSLVASWGPGAHYPLVGLILALLGALYLATRPGVSTRLAGRGLVSLFCLGLCALFFLGLGERGPIPMTVAARQFSPAGWLTWERRSGFIGTTIQGEYLPRRAPREPLGIVEERLHPNAGEDVSIERIRHWSAGLEAQVSASAGRTLVYEQFYFPGWQAWVDGKPVPIKVTPEGLMSFPLAPGKHRVEVRWGFTGARLGATLVSYLALLAAAALLLPPWARRCRRRAGSTRTAPPAEM